MMSRVDGAGRGGKAWGNGWAMVGSSSWVAKGNKDMLVTERCVVSIVRCWIVWRNEIIAK